MANAIDDALIVEYFSKLTSQVAYSSDSPGTNDVGGHRHVISLLTFKGVGYAD